MIIKARIKKLCLICKQKIKEGQHITILKNGIVEDYVKNACFTNLRDSDDSSIKYIEIEDIMCKKTKEYTEPYLQYISEMLDLKDVTIENNYFKFKAFSNNIKNMVVCSLVRFLNEKLGAVCPVIDTAELFLKPLLSDEPCPYENKLERFCYFYSKIPHDYFHIGHSWKPIDTKIKSLTQFKRYRFNMYNNGVNKFFIS